MSSANFKLKRTAAASRGFLATAGFSCLVPYRLSTDYKIDDLGMTSNGHFTTNVHDYEPRFNNEVTFTVESVYTRDHQQRCAEADPDPQNIWHNLDK